MLEMTPHGLSSANGEKIVEINLPRLEELETYFEEDSRTSDGLGRRGTRAIFRMLGWNLPRRQY